MNQVFSVEASGIHRRTKNPFSASFAVIAEDWKKATELVEREFDLSGISELKLSVKVSWSTVTLLEYSGAIPIHKR